jgi:DNA helicase-2/ATP-dependent DNA helicase PcrA
VIDIRELLKRNKSIDLASYKSKVLDYRKIKEHEIYNPQSEYQKYLKYLIKNPKNIERYNSLLIIMPEYYENNKFKGGIQQRSRLKVQLDYSNKLTLLEAIDNKDFYTISRAIDDLVKNIGRKRKKIKSITNNVIIKLFNKTSVEKWVKEDRLINKQGKKGETKKALESLMITFIEDPSVDNFLKIINYLKKVMKLKTKRHDLLNSIIKAMNISITENISVYEGMANHRNMIRRIGRKVHGKCFGTTLLTKGLEFDTVVILHAHRFNNSKHFYVAITRACKELIIFSEKKKINFSK